MYVLYVDESYNRHHVHLGVLGSGLGVRDAEHQLVEIARSASSEAFDIWFADTSVGRVPGPLELHGHRIVNGDDGWQYLSIERRIQVMDQVLQTLIDFEIEVLYRAVEIDSYRTNRGAGADPHPIMFSNLLERLNERMRDVRSAAVVIADEDHERHETLKSVLRRGKSVGTSGYRGQKLANVVDALHFVSSGESPLVQLADVVAWCVRRFLDGGYNDPRAQAVLSRHFDLIYSRVPEYKASYASVWSPPSKS